MAAQLYTDMMGREVQIPLFPQRIVSVVPSQTELLHYLGLEAQVVGITKFCVHPQDWFRNKKRVGGTKTLHLDKILELQPDLVIANKEENTREQIEELSRHVPVWVSDIHDVESALTMMENVGVITGRADKAQLLAASVRDGFHKLSAFPGRRPKVVYYIWKDPWMCAGGGTFINDIMERCGWTNVAANLERYPELTPEAARDLGADTYLLSSEPYPFGAKHIDLITSVHPGAVVTLVDGEYFSWYGSRMLPAIDYLLQVQQSI